MWSVEQDGVDAGELDPEEIAERVFIIRAGVGSSRGPQ